MSDAMPRWRDTETTVRHDDADREVDQSGADRVLVARFTEISICDDWATVFAP